MKSHMPCMQSHSIQALQGIPFFSLQSLSIDTYAQLFTARPEIVAREFAHMRFQIFRHIHRDMTFK